MVHAANFIANERLVEIMGTWRPNPSRAAQDSHSPARAASSERFRTTGSSSRCAAATTPPSRRSSIATIVGCEASKVKSLVFQARASLIESRTARDTPCDEIREQIATLRGGALRRGTLRRHVKHCAGCTEFREQVRNQRAMMAAVLPVIPALGLKHSALAAAGISGSGAGAAAGGGAGGGFAGLAGAGSAVKAAAIVAAAGIAVGGGVAVTHEIQQITSSGD